MLLSDDQHTICSSNWWTSIVSDWFPLSLPAVPLSVSSASSDESRRSVLSGSVTANTRFLLYQTSINLACVWATHWIVNLGVALPLCLSYSYLWILAGSPSNGLPSPSRFSLAACSHTRGLSPKQTSSPVTWCLMIIHRQYGDRWLHNLTYPLLKNLNIITRDVLWLCTDSMVTDDYTTLH